MELANGFIACNRGLLFSERRFREPLTGIRGLYTMVDGVE
jgi:hypothetical protein